MNLKTPHEISLELAGRVRTLRVAKKLTQEALAVRSGVSLSSIRKFEQTGQTTLIRLIQVAQALGAKNGFEELFHQSPYSSLEAIETEAKRTTQKPRVYKS